MYKINDELIPAETQLVAFIELRRELQGKCGGLCPRWNIEKSVFYGPFCNLCREYFGFLSHKYDDIDCPCLRNINPDELFLQLDEVIEELAEQLTKEYSS